MLSAVSMAVAVRSRSTQLPLHLGDTPLWSEERLARALVRGSGRPVELVLTENRSVLLSYRRVDGTVVLRLHRMFLYAPREVVHALGRGLHRRSRAADGTVRRFMNDNLHRVRRAKRRLPVLTTAGRHHDLDCVYEELNASFFDGRLRVPLTWGRGSGRARGGGLTFGSYDPVLGLIRIHPVLDSREVPRYFLESVVYHEMLHHKLGGVPDAAGRTVYHTRAFREAEARYPKYRKALAWEKENLPRLLRASQALERHRKAQAASARAGS
jgi:hypothetical protein